MNLKFHRPPVSVNDHSRKGPLFPDIGVLALVPEKWGGPWQPRHYVLTRLAAYFNVVWVGPAQGWREAWLGRTTEVSEKDLNNDLPPQALTLYQPSIWLPKFYRPTVLDSITTRRRLQQARNILLRQGCRRIVLYLWRPEFESALDMIPHDVSCYHIDDEYSFSPVEQLLDEREVRLIKRVTQVFIHSPALLEKKGHLNSRTLFVPNGVDYAAYARPYDEPTDLRDIPHPRIGYVGNIKAQLDFSLLLSLAERHPEWSFVLVGGMSDLGRQASLVEKFSRMPNVHFLGFKPVASLPAYTKYFDVCIMPYMVNGYTKFIFPLKLHEYLASGCPVVGVPIPSLLGFTHVIRLARTVEEWSCALADSLSSSNKGPASARQARLCVAREYDWNKLIHTIAQNMRDLAYRQQIESQHTA